MQFYSWKIIGDHEAILKVPYPDHALEVHAVHAFPGRSTRRSLILGRINRRFVKRAKIILIYPVRAESRRCLALKTSTWPAIGESISTRTTTAREETDPQSGFIQMHSRYEEKE